MRDMDEKILELYEKHETCREVAAELGVSSETVRRVLIKHGVPRTHRHPEKRRERKTGKRMPSHCGTKYCAAAVIMLRELLGMPTGDISEALGIPSDSVVNIFNRKRPDLKLGRCQRVSDETIEEVERKYLAGASTIAIGEEYGVNHSTISAWMGRRGHKRGKGGGPAFARANQAKRDAAIERFELSDDVDCTDRRARAKARRKYRIAKRNHDSGITWKKLAERNGSMECEVCGVMCDPHDRSWGSFGPTHPSVDHIVRISDGGEDTWNNSRLACMRCNLALNAEANREAREVRL